MAIELDLRINTDTFVAEGFGSLVLAVYDKGKYVYAGRVGTGFSLKQRHDIRLAVQRST
jgi:ATP-dependent DNA ligase